MLRLFTVLSSIAPNVFAWFLAFFGRKYSVATATVLAYVATTVAMIVCIKNILASITVLIVIPAWIQTAIAWFMPSNAVGIFSAIVSSNICRAGYDMVVTKIKLVNDAS